MTEEINKKFRIKVGKSAFIGIVREIKGKKVPYISIKDSTNVLGYKHSQYTRRLLLEGKLDTPLTPIKVEEGKFKKWFIPIPSLYFYLENKVVRSSKRRFILKLDLEDKDKVEEALKASGVEYTLELAYNKGKAKAKTEKVEEKEEILEDFSFNPK